jgi:hypothetical protein
MFVAIGGVGIVGSLFVAPALGAWVLSFGVLIQSLPPWAAWRVRLSTLAACIRALHGVAGLSLLTVVLHSLSLFSNSFIETEDWVVYFLWASSFVTFVLYTAAHLPTPLPGYLYVLAMLSLMTGRLAISSQVSAPPQDALVNAVALFLIGSSWLLGFRFRYPQIFREQPLARLLVLAVLLNLLAIFIFWTWLPGSLWLPRFVYACSLASTLFMVLSPPHPLCSADFRLFAVAACLFGTFLMLSGVRYLLSLSLFVMQATAFFAVVGQLRWRWSSFSDQRSYLCYLSVSAAWLAYLLFFASGNRFSFSTLRAATAFIGFENFYFAAGAVLLGFQCLSAPLFLLLLLPSLAGMGATSSPPPPPPSTTADHENRVTPSGRSPISTVRVFVWLYFLFSTLSAIFVTFARRHLMIWRVFAPKYMFDALLACVSGIVGALIEALL